MFCSEIKFTPNHRDFTHETTVLFYSGLYIIPCMSVRRNGTSPASENAGVHRGEATLYAIGNNIQERIENISSIKKLLIRLTAVGSYIRSVL